LFTESDDEYLKDLLFFISKYHFLLKIDFPPNINNYIDYSTIINKCYTLLNMTRKYSLTIYLTENSLLLDVVFFPKL
jgi:hypothetical protein